MENFTTAVDAAAVAAGAVDASCGNTKAANHDGPLVEGAAAARQAPSAAGRRSGDDGRRAHATLTERARAAAIALPCNYDVYVNLLLRVELVHDLARETLRPLRHLVYRLIFGIRRLNIVTVQLHARQ